MPVLAFNNWRPVWFLLFCTLNNQNSVFTNSGTLSPFISPTPGTPTGPLHVFDFLKIPPAALCVSPFLSVSVTTFSANSRPSFPHFLRSQSKFLTDGLTRESHRAVWQTRHRQEMSTLKIENERRKAFVQSWDKMQKLGLTGAEFPSHTRSAKTFCAARLIPSPHLLRLTEQIAQLLWSRIIFAYLTVGRTKSSLKPPSSHWIWIWISYNFNYSIIIMYRTRKIICWVRNPT